MDLHALERAPAQDGYLAGRGAAWFAFGMTVALMVFDYVDRQVIVSLFPHLKAEWGLSDKQLGALVSVVSLTVALGGIPVALFADRVSRVRSIAAMAAVWSLATISCMFTRNYAQLAGARALVGLGDGEAHERYSSGTEPSNDCRSARMSRIHRGRLPRQDDLATCPCAHFRQD